MDNIPPDSAEDDVRIYVEHKLENIAGLGMEEFRSLGKKAEGVFEWTRIAWEYEIDTRSRDPIKRFRYITAHSPRELKRLYHLILSQIARDYDGTDAEGILEQADEPLLDANGSTSDMKTLQDDLQSGTSSLVAADGGLGTCDKIEMMHLEPLKIFDRVIKEIGDLGLGMLSAASKMVLAEAEEQEKLRTIPPRMLSWGSWSSKLSNAQISSVVAREPKTSRMPELSLGRNIILETDDVIQKYDTAG
ncbi:hypothetical protein BU17DRAFT_102136 [Hysterangium stoloniferum]|nr:hypothetical protein BU17DRAFT_102136 [Hysterangium stoloniferum]